MRKRNEMDAVSDENNLFCRIILSSLFQIDPKIAFPKRAHPKVSYPYWTDLMYTLRGTSKESMLKFSTRNSAVLGTTSPYEIRYGIPTLEQVLCCCICLPTELFLSQP